MDFELSDNQRPVLDALESLLDRHAGVQRCRALADGYDHDLEKQLRVAGFFDLFAEESVGPLGATLAVERIAAHLGTVSATAHLLVLPALRLSESGPVALAQEDSPSPSRFGAQADMLLVAATGGGKDAASRSSPASRTEVESAYGFPLGHVVAGPAKELPPGTGAEMVNWWRVGASAEAVGLMGQALEIAVQYAKDRTTFGRPIGSFQALAHRLSELTVLLEGARWLTYEAAYHGAPEEGSATAAAHTMTAAARLTREVHQVMGAIGLTREHDLHLYTLRLQALRTELGGLRQHRRALATARWRAYAS